MSKLLIRYYLGVLFAASFVWCVGPDPVSADLVFDANADLVPGVLNPNDVWRYGYSTTLGGSLILFNEYVSVPNAIGWRTNLSLGAPGFVKILNTPTNGVLPGQTSLHGGPNGEFATLRFTTPTARNYDIRAIYFTGDTGNTDLHILQNGNAGSPLFEDASTTGGGAYSRIGMFLQNGDTLDLAIGIGGDSFFFDNTPVNLTVSASGDFDGSEHYNCEDVDALVGVIVAGTHIATFDLTGDHLVNLADRDAWLAAAGAANLASGNPYLLGDANLDGVVDGSDFGLWNANKFTSRAAWCAGDFNADGVVDGSDFGLWNANKFTSSDGMSAVPEPVASALVVVGAILWGIGQRRRQI